MDALIFPDQIVVHRAQGTDAYGNEGANFDNPETFTYPGFEAVQNALLLMPPTADVRPGDRFLLRGDTFSGTPSLIRSPAAPKLWAIRLDKVPD